MSETSPGTPARAGAKRNRLMFVYVAAAIVAIALMAVLVLVLSGGDKTGDGTGRSEITTTGSSDVVTAPGRSDR